MPLPWMFVFFLIFLTVFSVSLYMSSLPGDSSVSQPFVKPNSFSLVW